MLFSEKEIGVKYYLQAILFIIIGYDSKLVLRYKDMKKTVKCYRCGKEYDSKDRKEMISCSHCHQQMKITAKTESHFRFMRYLFVLAVCLAIAFAINLFTNNNYLALIATMAVAMLMANFADSWCLKLTEMIFGLEYEEYHTVKMSNKDRIRMEGQKKKKGLFRK